MKIIDTTTYFEEKLMMELRFNILDPYVDQFVVCEATFTHSGMKKPTKFNKEDYPDFKDKIIHLVLDKEPSNLIKSENKLTTNELRLNSIKRIEAQRNHIGTILEKFSQDDYIIYSDNDEIPNLENFDFKKNKNKIILFKQKLFYYKFDLSIPYIDWYGSKSCKIKDFLNTTWLRSIKNKKYYFYRIDTLFSKLKYQNLKIVENGGWHFSNLKTLKELERKYLNDEMHAEYEELGHSVDKIKNHLKNKTIGYNHSAKKNSNERYLPTKLANVDISFLPEYIQKNKQKYLEWFDASI